MPERVVVGLSLTEDAVAYLRALFPAGHELRVRSARAVTGEDLAWATVLCCFNVEPARIEENRNIRWLHVPAAGLDRFASLQESRPDLRLTCNGPFNAAAVAEHAVALMFALRRGVPRMVEGQLRRAWVRDAIMAMEPVLVRGGEAHVLGYGPVARALIDLLAALGLRVVVYRREATGSDPAVTRFHAFGDLARAIGTGDVVFGVLPAHVDTRHLLHAGVFAAMQPGAIVINVGRGQLIDHDALVEALVERRIGGAALDVFEEEPLPETSPLWTAPNLLISPHVGGQFRGNFRRMIDVFLEQFDAYLRAAPDLKNENRR